MSMKCKICSHPKRLEIDRALVTRNNIANVAKEFGVSYNSLYAHSQKHLTRQLAQAYDKIQTEQKFDLLQRIDQIIARAEKIFRRNYAKHRDGMALKALSEQRSTFELLAKISYSLQQARLAEIEIERMNSEDPDEQRLEAVREDLRVLDVEELKVLERIAEKVQRQDTSIDVLPKRTPILRRSKPSPVTYPYPERETPAERRKMADFPTIPSTTSPDAEDERDDEEQKPLPESIPIPSLRTDDPETRRRIRREIRYRKW